MKSPFNLNDQESSVESKIVVALERISEAFRVLLWNESRENSLSPIQMQILIFLLFHSDEKCRVGYLSKEFNMTKATVSDSVKILLQKNLIEKLDDAADTRSFLISLTEDGKAIARKVSGFASSIERPVQQLPAEHKQALLSGLLQVIHHLNRSGVITIQRMCFTCTHYKGENGNHYCNLLQQKLRESDLRVDCAEHEFAG